MKKVHLWGVLFLLSSTFTLTHAQFRVYNSELLKFGDINETPFISKGFEVSMPQLLLKSDYMGIKNTTSMLQLGKLNTQYNLLSGIKVYSDTMYLTINNAGIKIFEKPSVPQYRSSIGPGIGLEPPIYYVVPSLTKIESFGNKLVIGSSTNEVKEIYSNYYYSNETNSVLAPSDIKCKTNIRNLESALNEVNSIRIVRFDYLKMDSIQEKVTDPNRSNRVGVIAQELQEIYPEAIHYNEQSDMMMVDYGALIPFLIKAIQEQQAEIEELKKSIIR